MGENNPFQTPQNANGLKGGQPPKRSSTGPTLVGFLLGAAVPIAFAAYGQYQEATYTESLAPETAACGLGGLAVLMVMIIGTPICGIFGGLIGWLSSRF